MSNPENDILNKYFDSIRNEKYRESFNDVSDWLKKEAAYTEIKPEKKKTSITRFVFSEGRLKFAYLFIILILAGITSNFSVTRTENVGSVMSWTIAKQKTDAIKKIDNLDWVDKSQLVVEEAKTDNGTVLTYKMLMPTANTNEIEAYKSELANIKDIMTIDVQPISEPVKQPLYAVALEKVFRYDYNKNNVNPDELKRNLYEQLKYAGLQKYVDFDNSANGSAGKLVGINLAAVPDNERIKIHNDIVNSYDIDEALDEIDEAIRPYKVLNDSVIKCIFVKIGDENVTPRVIISEVYRSLDTLHHKLKNNEYKRKEKMEKFKNKMDRFNRSMEKFSEKMKSYGDYMAKYGEEMAKYGEEMAKYGEEMSKYKEEIDELKNLPKFNFNFEIPDVPEAPEAPEPPDVDVEVEVPEAPEAPDIPDVDFNFNFNFNDLDKNIKIMVDSINKRFNQDKVESWGKNYEKKMKKFEEKMKKYGKDMKLRFDTLKIKNYYEEDEDNDNDNDSDNNNDDD